jgi:plasmid maintenance system antidote protein VapI
MRKKILILAIIVSVSGTMLINCQSSVEQAKKNVENAQDEVVITKQELNMAIKDSVQLYKKNALKKIAANEERIADLKAEAIKKKEFKVKYEAIINEWEQTNKDIKKRLNDYNDEGEEMWTSFKDEVTYDMDELEQAIANIFVDNKE